MKRLFLCVILLAAWGHAAYNAAGQGLGDATQCFPTNTTVDATNTIWTCPFAYSWISFVNDSGTNVYMTPGTQFLNISSTNVVFYGSGVFSKSVASNKTVIVTNSILYTAVAGQGTRLNAQGGNVFYDATGRPTKHDFQFISQGGDGNNVAIQIGLTQ